MFLVPVIFNALAERGEIPSSLILWVGGAFLVVPYVLLVSEKLVDLFFKRWHEKLERTLHTMPLEQLVASIRDVLQNKDPVEEEKLLGRLQKERFRAVPLIIERYRKKRKSEEKVQHYSIEPKGEVHAGAGHHHIGLDTDCLPPGEAIPEAAPWVHFGDGSATIDMQLPAGQHTLTIQIGDGEHVTSDEPGLCQSITITVEEG